MLWPQDEGTTSGVMTAVRVRPMSDDERKAGCRNIITMVDNQTTVVDPAGLSPTSASSSSASSFRRRQSGQLNPANSSPSKLASMVHDSPTKRPSLSAKSSKVWSQSFTYDHSFWSCDPDHVHHADQQLVYDHIGTHVLSTAWNERLHVSLFAYGQTGAGKSFSMMGKSKSNHHEARGLVPRICHALFDAMQSSPPTVSATSTTSHVQTSSQIKDDGTLDKQTTASHPSPTCTVKMTFVEIYNERVYDLLDPHTKESLKVREHPANGTYVEHVSNLVVTSAHDIEYLVAEGNKTRTVAATSMNQLSSRSHAILTLTLHWLDKRLAPTKVCMVDLAGSERADVVACGDRLREAAAINKSLSALGDVINALAATTNHAAAGKSISTGFVQYRNSVLTRLLKDSLSGSGRLVMLAAISPCCIHYDETLSTLKYVERAKLAFVAQPSAQLQAVEASGAVDEGNAVMQLLRLELSMLRSQLRVAQQLGDLRPPSQVEEEVEIESSAQNVLDCTTLSDPRYTERVVYCIEEGITTPLHAILHCTNNTVRVRPAAVAAVRVNGRPILDTTELRHGARLMLGDHHVFRYDAAHTSERAPDMDWHGAHQELLDQLLTQGSHDDSNNVSILRELVAVPMLAVGTHHMGFRWANGTKR
ncbi:hypothetical protein DYB25_012123 [Aphanomyces astaci]|uniref:Kinesin motor domain-containing protein n=1 Tax=Aphanomyces astaci TaxID=112090 RepID=A0A397A748_APHAT|nr:hypothetical protein DYB25_012123 [Aphanomyces astaci]